MLLLAADSDLAGREVDDEHAGAPLSHRELAASPTPDRCGISCGTVGELVVDGRHLRDQSAVLRPGARRVARAADMFIADPAPVLTRQDLCDRCRAVAHVRAVLPAGNDLLFCEHHARQHAPRLREIGALLSPEP